MAVKRDAMELTLHGHNTERIASREASMRTADKKTADRNFRRNNGNQNAANATSWLMGEERMPLYILDKCIEPATVGYIDHRIIWVAE
jgi:hypothetical protein